MASSNLSLPQQPGEGGPAVAPSLGAPVLVHRYLRLPQAARASVPLAVMAALWWASSRSGGTTKVGLLQVVGHNALHVVAYFVLGASMLLALMRLDRAPASATAVRTYGALLATVAYGVVDELHQSFVPGRVASTADLVSDLGGALLAAAWLQFGGPSAGSRRRLAGLGFVAAVVGVSAASWR